MQKVYCLFLQPALKIASRNERIGDGVGESSVAAGLLTTCTTGVYGTEPPAAPPRAVSACIQGVAVGRKAMLKMTAAAKRMHHGRTCEASLV